MDLHVSHYSPTGRFLVQETFPQDSAPVYINIDISPEMAAQSAQRNQAFCVTASDWSPQFLANQHETNQHKSAGLIGLFHATSSVLLSVESYWNYRKPKQRGVQGYLSSLQGRVVSHMLLTFFSDIYKKIWHLAESHFS